jgi:flagellin
MSGFGDFNRINTNVTAMEAALSLRKVNKELGASQLKLSTGLKINKSEDDAAGYSIATELRSTIKGLETALQNVGDAKSVLGIVEGAYASIMDNLIEMKTLATQGANATLGQTERNYIGDQIEALANDINNIADSTRYNGLQLLDGASADDDDAGDLTGDFTFKVQSGDSEDDVTSITLGDVNMGNLFNDLDAGNLDTTDAGNIAIAAVTDATAAGAGDEARGVLTFDATVSLADMNEFIGLVDAAIGRLNEDINALGINQRTLSGKEIQLSEAITANSAAQSRIMDTDFAKEQSNSIRLQILQQTATAALSQANMGPQAVLGFLG